LEWQHGQEKLCRSWSPHHRPRRLAVTVRALPAADVETTTPRRGAPRGAAMLAPPTPCLPGDNARTAKGVFHRRRL